MVLSGGNHGSYFSINLGGSWPLTMAVYTAAGVSGAHLNPAVTLPAGSCSSA